MARYVTMFPDQSEWVKRCCKLGGGESLACIWKTTGYKGPPELFSMWACLLGSDDMGPLAADNIKSQAASFRRRLRTFQLAHGFTPHPALLLQGVCDSSLPINV